MSDSTVIKDIQELKNLVAENKELRVMLSECNKILCHKNELIEILGHQIAKKDLEIERLKKELKRCGKVQKDETLSD